MSIGSHFDCACENKAAIISAGEDHGFCAEENNAFLVADIPANLAPRLASLPIFITLDAALTHYVSFLHFKLMQSANRFQSSEQQMLLLLIQLLQEGYGQAFSIDKRIEVAKAYLDHNFKEPISLALLTTIAHLSQRQLSELFRKDIGMSPQQYLIEKRMQEAWRLLETQQYSIQHVANQVGYSNLSAFSDRFKKHFGHPASHFRLINK
jgi:AraC-like DNA-binding protein